MAPKPTYQELVNQIAELKKQNEGFQFSFQKEGQVLYYNTVLNNMGDPVFVKDDKSRLLIVNDAFCEMFNLERDQILGKTLAEDVSPKERESFLKIDKLVLESGVENINEESLTVRAGQTKIISTRKTRHIDSEDNKFLIGIIRDITERKNKEEHLRALNQQLAANEQQLRAANQQLSASEQQLLASNQQLRASEQQLLASNQQLRANEQQLRAANQLLINSEKEIIKHKEKVEESEQKYKALYENAPLSYQSLNEDGSFKDVNPAWLSTLGYKREEVIGKFYKDFLHPDWQDHFNENFPKFKKRGYVSGVEFKIRHKKGHYIDISFEGCIGYHPDGSFKQTYCVFQDITTKKKAEKDLIQNQYYLSKAQEMGNIGTWELDIIANNLVWTDEAYHIFGIPIGTEISYELFLAVVHPDDRDLVNERWTAALNKEPYDIEHRLLINGNVKWVRQKAEVKFNSKGKAVKAIGFSQDITKSKESEQQLIIAKEKAEESDRLKSAFLANMSHEIRTPMNGILGFTDLLKKPKLSGAEKENYITIIRRSGDRLLNTVNDLIDFSKIEAGQMQKTVSKVNINELIEQLFAFFNVETEKRGLQLFLDTTSSDKNINLLSDKEKIYSILTNLIKNAIKYSKKGRIDIGYEVKENELEFFVKDCGVGIPKEKLDIIFNRFIRAGEDAEHFTEGSGLGLSISKAYAEMLGGKIWVESKVGEGSQFYFTIPYDLSKEKISSTKEVGSEAKSEAQIKDLKILIAEDDEFADDLLSILVKDMSKEVFHTKNGVTAVEICRKHPDIDLILMDINMPEMNGYEASKQIREFNKDVIIISQTAYALAGDNEKSIEAGCNDYISKPIEQAKLLSIIEKHFTKQ